MFYLVYWYIWYSFDYYLFLTCFTSCFFTYFKVEHQHQTFMSLFSIITNINEYFQISNPLHPFIKFNKDLQLLHLFWLPPFILHLRVREECNFCWNVLLVTLRKNLVATLNKLLSLFATAIINIYIQ